MAQAEEPMVAMFADEIARMKTDKLCKNPNCFGRGYIGIGIESTTQHKYLIMCRCATIDNDHGYAEIIKHLSVMNKANINLLAEKKTLRATLSEELQRLSAKTEVVKEISINLQSIATRPNFFKRFFSRKEKGKKLYPVPASNNSSLSITPPHLADIQGTLDK